MILVFDIQRLVQVKSSPLGSRWQRFLQSFWRNVSLIKEGKLRPGVVWHVCRIKFE